jgi:hypothetical protein
MVLGLMDRNFRWGAILLPLAGLVLPTLAQAVPSFARQTGLACMQCHTVFPQLTPLGREFKLTGYTMTDSTKGHQKGLQEDWMPPLSFMMQVSQSFTQKKQPDTQNGNVLFPDQMSLFYAGRISDKAGAFIQTTYESPDDHFTLDNVDLRFASSRQSDGGSNLTYGVTLNNSPSAQDLWNSTPAWSYPYASSGVAPAPAAGVLLDGGLGQQVGGLGFYGMWNNRLYGELTLYRAAQIGQDQPPGAGSTDTLANTSPYWRIAYEHNWGEHNLEVGTYGMFADVIPSGVNGPANRYHDVALDAQYQYLAGVRTFTLHTTFMHEKQTLDASYPTAASNSSNILKTFRLDATYYMHRSYGGTLGYFSTTGDTDSLLYAPSAISGSLTGSPDTTGWIAEFDYLPWENTKFALQYMRYNKFNGSSSNYDGAGRSASDNNTLYLNGWLNF